MTTEVFVGAQNLWRKSRPDGVNSYKNKTQAGRFLMSPSSLGTVPYEFIENEKTKCNNVIL